LFLSYILVSYRNIGLIVLRILAPCKLGGGFRRFGGTYCFLTAEVVLLGKGGFIIGLEEEKTEGVGHSETRNEGENDPASPLQQQLKLCHL
jgi:hypothetical protein